MPAEEVEAKAKRASQRGSPGDKRIRPFLSVPRQLANLSSKKIFPPRGPSRDVKCVTLQIVEMDLPWCAGGTDPFGPCPINVCAFANNSGGWHYTV